MDEVDELYSQHVSYLSGGWGDSGNSMNFFTEWIKRKNRKRKLKDYIQQSISYGDFNGTSGKPLSYYIDCRPLVVNSSIRLSIIKSFFDIIETENVVFAGPLTSGAILASDMALFKKTDAIIVNSKEDKVIYPLDTDLKNKEIVLVDDVITTGHTIRKCMELISYPISKVLCIIDREKFEKINNIDVVSLFSLRIWWFNFMYMTTFAAGTGNPAVTDNGLLGDTWNGTHYVAAQGDIGKHTIPTGITNTVWTEV